MTHNPNSPAEQPPIIVGALNQHDLESLRSRSEAQEDSRNHLTEAAASLALTGNLERPLYGIATQQVDGETVVQGYVLLTGPDYGTHLRNDPERLQKFGLNPDVRQAYEALSVEQKQGGLVKSPVSEQKNSHDQVDKVDDGGEFAHLWDEPPEANIAELTAAKETQPDPRIKALFAPRLTNEEKSKQAKPKELKHEEFADLWSPEEPKPFDPVKYAAEQATERKKQIVEPSDGQKLIAYHELQHAKSLDPSIEAIIDKYIPKTEGIPDAQGVIDQVRTNASLRYELGSYLLRDKLPKIKRENPLGVPSRVYTGGDKNPNHPGYDRPKSLKSDEYAAMLALAMIDGTFVDPGPHDSIEVNEDGQVIRGQHRAGAYLLLGKPIR